ncbi:hypothetical protein QFZ42_004413 [Variovorax paradoxus]|nr:hypothetical protein [Variovorax paradoxus]
MPARRGKDTGVQPVAQGSQEGGDAVRSPQAHHETGLAPASRTQWCARRLPADGISSIVAHCSRELAPVPRGEKPMMSTSSRSQSWSLPWTLLGLLPPKASTSTNVRLSPSIPGPPGLKKIAPRRWDGLAASHAAWPLRHRLAQCSRSPAGHAHSYSELGRLAPSGAGDLIVDSGDADVTSLPFHSLFSIGRERVRRCWSWLSVAIATPTTGGKQDREDTGHHIREIARIRRKAREPEHATAPTSRSGTTTKRGASFATSLELRPAPKTMPTAKGRAATPARAGPSQDNARLLSLRRMMISNWPQQNLTVTGNVGLGNISGCADDGVRHG